MLRPLVAILPGPTLPPRLLPSRPDVTIASFASLAGLVARATDERATCVVADAAALVRGDVGRLRAACPDATLCVVGDAPEPGADAALAAGDDLRDRLVATIRFALGEPMRSGPRVAATGVVVIDDRARLRILDVSEGGVKVAAAPREIIGDRALRIELDGGPTIAACGREIRRGRAELVLSLNALVATERTNLRRWMLSHDVGLVRIMPAPRARRPR